MPSPLSRRDLLTASAAGLAAAAMPAAAVRAADEPGFVSLFNGRDLSGWKMGPDKSWAVDHGVITLKRANYDGREHNSDYLWLARPLGDFIVELEALIPEKTNSGIYLRTADPMDPVPTGIEVQVFDSHGRPEPHKKQTAGAIYDCLAPAVNAIKPPGQWNLYRITCLGSRIYVELNGAPVIHMNLDLWHTARQNPDGTPNKFPTALKDMARRGHFGFQDHGRPVSYRNIRLRSLD